MTYDEMVKYLREKAGAFDYQGWTETAIDYELAADAIEKLIEIIQNHDFLESLVKPDWIPVTERLPSVEDKVIVAIRDESGDTRYDYTNTGWYSGNGYKWVVEDEYCSWVTHWMPLPEPPKEE